MKQYLGVAVCDAVWYFSNSIPIQELFSYSNSDCDPLNWFYAYYGT